MRRSCKECENARPERVSREFVFVFITFSEFSSHNGQHLTRRSVTSTTIPCQLSDDYSR